LLVAVVAQIMQRVVMFAGYLRRFAARASGLAFGLAVAVRAARMPAASKRPAL
jgi:hypothetical protein